MTLSDIFLIIAGCLILEGAFPLLFPMAWKKRMAEVNRLSPGQLRSVGLALVVIGVLLFGLAS